MSARMGLPAALAVAGLLLAGRASADSLTLSIANQAQGTPLRCVVELAHWVTQEAGPIAPGETLRLPFENELETGEVILRNSLGRAMEVEGLYCFFGQGAAPVRAVLAIDALRHARQSLTARCNDRERPSCAIGPP